MRMSIHRPAKLTSEISEPGVWAFAVGTSIGWGSLVVTSNTYLIQAGPWGSVLGLLIGAAVMMVICRNYAYLMQIYPEAGGAYSYSSNVFGHDHGFLTGWFLVLTYLAILWANATSIPLFMRNFVGDFFEFGRLYSLFGYDVYTGEILLTMAAIVLIAFLCMQKSRVSIALMIGLVCLFTAGISVVFAAAVTGMQSGITPGFIPDTGAFRQIIRIAVISPWAFIGFESISHGGEEFAFKRTKVFRLLIVSVLSVTLLYAFVTLLSVTAYPERYSSWLEYIQDHENLSGLEAFPAFYAANHYMGSAGVGILMISLLSLVVTSMIGNTNALSRLFYAQAKDKVLPGCFEKLNRKGVPANAILLIAGVSLLIPFAGRTAIGWIVDVTTIGATLIYGFVSAAALKTARQREDRAERVTGLAGLAAMVIYGLYLLLPSLISTGSLNKETYFLFIIWSISGFLYFRSILHRDREKRFGVSAIVWVVLLSMVLFISLIWMRQSMIASNDQTMENIRQYYAQQTYEGHIQDEQFIEKQMDELEASNIRTVLMSVGMFAFALTVMLTNHRAMKRRTKESETMANIDPMTGVKSKHAFLNREKLINAAMEKGSMEDYAVAVCDVNGLKRINDTLGHKAGDEYICSASRLICEIFDHSPVYRIGGDEFVVILTGKDYEHRKELMQTLHARSAENIASDGAVVSGGLAECEPPDTGFHPVFERADARMYEEKQLLKSMGSITRDEMPDEPDETGKGSAPILAIRKRILIAEDIAINQMLLGAILEEDYDILYAADGAETLEILQTEEDQISLLLLDLQMPQINGIEVLRTMKSDPSLRDIPVIVLTGDQEAEVECLNLGAIDFIPKPYPGAEIVKARVSKCIELSEGRNIIQSTERDALTRLFNVDYFIRYAETFDRYYEDLAMDAVVIDINRFQIINERYGKQFGDEVLQRLGELVRQAARNTSGICCRQGADTFLLYCPHREDYAGMLEGLSIGFAEDGSDAAKEKVHLRMGIYSCVDKTLDIERRFDRARKAADSVRDSRVESIGFYDAGIHEMQIHRDRLLEDFRPCLEQNCFKVYLQPKYNIRQDRPVLASAEALVRWVHPEFGMISPAEFVPLLEESGLIQELDTFVWEHTAEQIHFWKDHLGRSIPVSVNVSRIDMLATNLKEILTHILETYQLEPSDLILEVTESAYTGSSDPVISMARELRETGFMIEMDDFGTGYSSLGMLNHLPIDALKLDMSFVRTAFAGKVHDVRIIQLILDIAQYLHVPVIAEGVETEEQLRALKELGCDIAQGYYFSKPIPREEFERFFRNN